MLKTPQHVAVSEFEATADEDLWKRDKIDVPVLMILAKQPVWSPEYEYSEPRIGALLHDKDKLGEWMQTVPSPEPLEVGAEVKGKK